MDRRAVFAVDSASGDKSGMRGYSEGSPSEYQIALAQLLAQGLTDEAIARRLGISDRSVRRRVAEIVDILGARSRFQAGVNAAEAGWLG